MRKPYRVVFLEHDFSYPPGKPAFTATADRYSWTAVGGPELADGPVEGTRKNLLRLGTMLGRPVRIYDWRETQHFWGYLHGFVLSNGAVEVSANVDDLVNTGNVFWTEAGGGSGETGYTANSESVALYWAHELIDALTDGSSGAASALVAQVLEDHAFPEVISRILGGDKYPLSGKLDFRGWYPALSWMYYRTTKGRASFSSTTNLDLQKFGRQPSQARLAQSFYTSSSYTVKCLNVVLNVGTVGVCSDSCRMSICVNDPGGGPGGIDVPGAEVQHVDLLSADMDTRALRVTTAFGCGELNGYAPSTKFWLVLERTGALDYNFYYMAGVSEDLPVTGEFLIYDSGAGAWGARTPGCTLLHVVNESWDKYHAVEDLVANCGPFLAGTDLMNATAGVYAPLYLNGDRKGLDLLDDFIRGGNSASRRLMPWITSERLLRLDVIPTVPTGDSALRIRDDGTVVNKLRRRVKYPSDLVGRWAMTELARELAQSSAGYLANAGHSLVQRAEMDCLTGQTTVSDLLLEEEVIAEG